MIDLWILLAGFLLGVGFTHLWDSNDPWAFTLWPLYSFLVLPVLAVLWLLELTSCDCRLKKVKRK